MFTLINGRKVAALALGLVLMSSVTGQAFAFTCLSNEGEEAMGHCAKQCNFDPDSSSNPFSIIACF